MENQKNDSASGHTREWNLGGFGVIKVAPEVQNFDGAYASHHRSFAFSSHIYISNKHFCQKQPECFEWEDMQCLSV